MPKVRKNEVRIAYEHLNPTIQRYIKREGMPVLAEKIQEMFAPELDLLSIDSYLKERHTIRAQRAAQRAAEIAAAGNVSLIPIFPKMPLVFPTIGVLGGIGSREVDGVFLRVLHKQLVRVMERGGVLNTAYEGNYQEGWMNPATIAKTHPIFHVAPNGDIIFHKETRSEYLKWQTQRKLKTSVAWWWREYLRPPTVPQTVKEWAKQRAAVLAEKLKGLKPVPVPSRSPVPVSFRRTKS
ncbi:hypothetical protein KJ765_02075 [Candidatus Micrarchaeota archaeon]|nr:hypothetical protein [Candidatus Micrarchaeota archaeon]